MDKYIWHKNEQLVFDSINVNFLKNKTPFSLISLDVIEKRYKELVSNMPENFVYAYPLKVNPLVPVVYKIMELNNGIVEVSSVNELKLVKKLGARTILCNGFKDEEYFNEIKKHYYGRIIPIAESSEELQKIEGEYGLRVNINFESKSSRFGQKSQNRFGISMGEILGLNLKEQPALLHCHIGSQITDDQELITGLKIFFEFATKNFNPEFIDIGGGLPIQYYEKIGFDYERFFKNIKELTKDYTGKVIAEYGSFIVGPSQLTAVSVIDEKKVENTKWKIIDSSLFRIIPDKYLLKQEFQIYSSNAKNKNTFMIGSKNCDSTDCCGPVELGEGKICFYPTGAYQNTLTGLGGMGLCGLPSPRILIKDGLQVSEYRKDTRIESYYPKTISQAVNAKEISITKLEQEN